MQVVFYKKQNGTVPVEDFLQSLDMKMQAKVVRAIDMLKVNGYELREPYSKSLGDGIFELRVQVATDISRVLYFFVVNGKVVLTHGFIKKTEKTPLSEIDRAKRYRKDYEEREC